MNVINIENIYLNGRWHHNANVTLNTNGNLTLADSKHPASTSLQGVFIPSFTNFHSHAFQYAMAGKGEFYRAKKGEDFWSWREAMYDLALNISPEKLNKIAQMLYLEMIRNGYDTVVEFHYLHNQFDGSPYENRSEMGDALIQAAKTVGINLVLTPVYYKQGGFSKPATDSQRRFIFDSSQDYLEYYATLKAKEKEYDHLTVLGGIHSLRAASESDIKTIFSATTGDFHIHIAEQLKEVNDCIAHNGMRPVEYLLDILDDHQRLQLVHATHLSEKEIELVASSGANVVICPTTESNLGDGTFPLHNYLSKSGIATVGSDSHVSISPFEELKCLDFSQRLISHSRSHSMAGNEGELGNHLIDTFSGYVKGKAYNRKQNLIKLNQKHPILGARDLNKILSSLVSCYDRTMIEDIYLTRESKFLTTKNTESISQEYFSLF